MRFRIRQFFRRRESRTNLHLFHRLAPDGNRRRGGEFGRGANEDNSGGRGHNGSGFTFWMAGGGVKGGYVHGATDEIGQEAVEGIMDFHDLHATILHLLGLDHHRLTYHYAGRDFRLTDTKGKVNRAILA